MFHSVKVFCEIARRNIVESEKPQGMKRTYAVQVTRVRAGTLEMTEATLLMGSKGQKRILEAILRARSLVGCLVNEQALA